MKTKVSYSVIGLVLGLALGYALFYEKNSLSVQADLENTGNPKDLINLGN